MNQGSIGCALSEMQDGTSGKIISVNAGQVAKRRLAHLGLLPGVQVVKKRGAPFHGPIEIIVRGTVLALGRGIASRILVEVEE